WRRSFDGLGPASTIRARLDSAAAPLAGLLGFGGPTAIETIDLALVATLRAEPDAVLLPVAPWAARPDGCCRSATTAAIRRLALAARRRPRGFGCGARGPARRRAPARHGAARWIVRAGVDDRISHSLPAVRRGSRTGSAVASGVSRWLQHRVAQSRRRAPRA